MWKRSYGVVTTYVHADAYNLEAFAKIQSEQLERKTTALSYIRCMRMDRSHKSTIGVRNCSMRIVPIAIFSDQNYKGGCDGTLLARAVAQGRRDQEEDPSVGTT